MAGGERNMKDREDAERPEEGTGRDTLEKTAAEPPGEGAVVSGSDELRDPEWAGGAKTARAHAGQVHGKKLEKAVSLKARVLVAAAFALVALGAAAFLAVLMARAPVEKAEEYLAALAQGRIDQAWDMLHETSDFKEEGDLQGYMEYVERRMGAVTGWRTHLWYLTGSRSYLDVELEREGEVHSFRLGLRNDGAGWRIYEPVEDQRPDPFR